MRQRGQPSNFYRDAHIAALYAAGLTVDQIAWAWGTTRGATNRVLKRLGMTGQRKTGRPKKRPLPFVPMQPQCRRVQMIWCG